MSTEKAKKSTFVQRIMDRLNGGEVVRLNKFAKGLRSYVVDQIDAIQKRIKKNSDRIEEQEAELISYIETVDQEKIATVDGRDAYYPEYIAGLDTIFDKIEDLEDKKKADQRLLDRRQKLISRTKD